MALHFSVDEEYYESEAFRKRRPYDNHDITLPNEIKMQNDR